MELLNTYPQISLFWFGSAGTIVTKKIASVFIILAVFLALAGCTKKQSETVTTLAQLHEPARKIGVPTGAKSDEIAREHFPEAEIVQYKNTSEGFIAVKTGKIDAFCFTKNTMQYVVNQNTELRLLDESIGANDLAIAARLNDSALMAQVNGFIKTFNKSNLLLEMKERWLGEGPEPAMPEIKPTANPARTIIVGVSNEDQPMAYLDAHGQPKGFDVEYALRLGKELNAMVEFKAMEWPGLIPSLQSGKIDLIISNLNVTEERRQSMLLSDVYISTDLVMMVRKDGNTTATTAQTLRTKDSVGKKISPLSGRPDVSRSRLGVMIGSANEIYAETHYPQARILRFNNYADSSAALLGNKLDYAMMIYTSALNFTKNNPELEIVSDFLTDEWLCIGVNKNNPKLHAKISDAIARYLADGTMAEILSHWLKNDGSDYTVIETPKADIKAPVLKMAIVSSREPTTFMLNGKYAGVDIELIERVAYELGYRMEYLDMEWGGVISAMGSEKADVCLGMYAMPERRKQVLFTVPYLANPQVLIAKKTGAQTARPFRPDGFSGKTFAPASPDFWASIKIGFERNLLFENRWEMIAKGLRVSLIITVFAFALATLLGFAVCGLKMSNNPVLRAIGSFYVTVLRGTPIVVLLMITFYVIFAKSSISGTLVAIIAFGANGAAFIGEIIRSAILTVDKGQVEAARSMGFSEAGAFFTVTFPQAVRVAFPVYMSEFISMFKMTSVVGYIAIVDLTKAGDIIRSRTYDAFFPLIMVALTYLLAASVMIWLFNLINRKTNKRLGRAK